MIPSDDLGVIHMNVNRSFSDDRDQAIPQIGSLEPPPFPSADSSGPWSVWGSVVVGAVLAAVIGTWLVWFSVSLQRKFQVEDIQAACQRVMPETVDRCVDTVIIQRGGARR
jgi:hypothetical protein